MRTVALKDIDLLIDNITSIFAVTCADNDKYVLSIGMNDGMVYSANYGTRLAAETARDRVLRIINGEYLPSAGTVVGIAMSDSVPSIDRDGHLVSMKLVEPDDLETKNKS